MVVALKDVKALKCLKTHVPYYLLYALSYLAEFVSCLPYP